MAKKTSDNAAGPREGLAYLLKRVQSALRAEMDRALAVHDVTTPQYVVLAMLARVPELSNADLARRSFVTPQTMIRILDILTDEGRISRTPHPTHGRVLLVSLTPAGRKLLARCHAATARVEAQLVSRLSRSEQAQLGTLLQACVEGLRGPGRSHR